MGEVDKEVTKTLATKAVTPNPFDTKGLESTKAASRRRAAAKPAFRKLPPSDVFIVVLGRDGPRLWDNIREGTVAKFAKPPKE